MHFVVDDGQIYMYDQRQILGTCLPMPTLHTILTYLAELHVGDDDECVKQVDRV